MTGKSTWLQQNFKGALKIDLLHEQTYINYLTDTGLLEREVLAFHKKDPQGWVLIDEIQRIPSLLNEVHRLIEAHKIKFGLTGSSARKLKRGGGNLLAGRATELKLFPLTSIELAHDFDLEMAMRFGTLPEAWTSHLAEKRQLLQSYASVYLKEEIQAEGLVRNLPSFAKFLRLAAESVSHEINYSSIAKETGVASKTITGYFSILEDTFIGFFLPPWTSTVRKELAGSPKFYFFDNGVTNALRENLTDPPTGDVYGRLFEQFVIQQVRSILHYRSFEGSLSYWKARGGREVDLVISRGSKPLLAIEIKATTRPSKEDFGGLVSFSDEYPKVPGLVVSNQIRATEYGPYQALPVLEFLQSLHDGQLLSL
jgi:predicted AAA+ superfamily ATPase